MSQAASTSTSAATGGSINAASSTVNWTLIGVVAVVAGAILWWFKTRRKK
jgi:LPXTG-motif cell wall-anchored protein